MYRRNYKDKRKGSPKPYKHRKNTAAKDARYSQSNFRLITYGCKRDKSPAWERDKRIIDRRRKRHSRSRSRSRGRHGHSPGHRRRSKSRERHGHSPDNRRRSKSRERHGHSPHNRRRSKSRSPDRHERRVRSKSPKERGTVEDRKPSPDDKIIENNIDDKPVVTEEEEEEINKEFHVLDIDFNIPENTKAHNTDKYECTEEREKNNKRLKAELVVRRGKPFVLKITFDREYDKKQHDLEFSFTTGDDPKPPKGTAAEFDMDENKNGVGHHSEWYAKMTENKNKTITVAITPPSNCIIGEWDFSILTSSKIKPDDRPIILKYKCPKDVTILLNPWCEHDDVYLTTTDLLKEYVLNDTGAVFQGNYKQINAKVWNFAQFEDDILDISLHLIRSHFGSKVDSGMGDPIKLSRAITEIVNSTQGGVLEGNWSGNYEGGTSPTLWSSSKNILKQYAKTGEGVKYGQCWVFSAVTTTVCRAIGLPARSITNFASAHDSDASVSIDQEYVFDKKKDKYVKLPGGDSIWNFHVWNEVWMSRTDLGRGFDGWQVIDSTPQETSGGVYRCGPAPVVAIKRGELGRMQYDLPFVFAEVNADVIKWEKQTSSKWKKVKVETSKVGKNISTKRPDGDPYEENTSLFSFMDNKNEQRMDITNEYKYPEGTLEERLAVKNAAKASLRERAVEEYEHEDVVLEIVDKDGILIGSSFDVEVKAKNQSKDHKVRTITALDISVAATSYNGETGDEFAEKRFKKDVRLKFNEEETFKFTLSPDEYLGKLKEQYMMLITTTAHIKETDKIHIQDEDYRLRRPDIAVEAPKREQRGKPFEIEVSFKNPLPRSMTNCIVYVEGNKITDIEEKISDIAAHTTWKHTMKVTAHRKGKITLNVTFDCKELKDIVGNANVLIE